jgi:hypothetical protein
MDEMDCMDFVDGMDAPAEKTERRSGDRCNPAVQKNRHDKAQTVCNAPPPHSPGGVHTVHFVHKVHAATYRPGTGTAKRSRPEFILARRESIFKGEV